MDKDNLKKNASRYDDPTAYQAITNVDKEDERFHKVLRLIFMLCEIAGFRVDGRISLIDKGSGRVWK